jgi:hypothetical protein
MLPSWFLSVAQYMVSIWSSLRSSFRLRMKSEYSSWFRPCKAHKATRILSGGA